MDKETRDYWKEKQEKQQLSLEFIIFMLLILAGELVFVAKELAELLAR